MLDVDKALAALTEIRGFLAAHPAFCTVVLWPLVSAALVALFKARTPAEYARIGTRYPAWFWSRWVVAMQLVGALGLDPVKALKLVKKLATGRDDDDQDKPARARRKTRSGLPYIGGVLAAAILCTTSVSGCTALQTRDIVDLIAGKVACGLANMDLPNDQIALRCAFEPGDIEKIFKIIEDARVAKAKAQAEAHDRGLEEGQRAGCGPK